jgi:hypothetical protein
MTPPLAGGPKRTRRLEQPLIESEIGDWPEQIAAAIELAEGVGFEPTVGLTPRSISSRVP